MGLSKNGATKPKWKSLLHECKRRNENIEGERMINSSDRMHP
jgi:hypothetical protein